MTARLRKNPAQEGGNPPPWGQNPARRGRNPSRGRRRAALWRKAASALCVLILAGGLTSCGGSRRLTLRVGAPETSGWYAAAEGFRDRVERDGRWKVSIRTEEGDSDLELNSLAVLAEGAPALAAVSMPWLFPEGYEDVDRLLLREDSPGQAEVFALVRETGQEPLALGENGFFQLTCDTRSLTEPGDIPGVTLSVPADGPAADFLRTLGAAVDIRPGPAALPALQNAVLDGQSDTLDGIRTDGSYLVQRYMTIWNCAYDPIVLTISGDLWGRLTPEDRELFRTAAVGACVEQVISVRSGLEGAVAAIRETGVEVTELDAGELASFQALTGPVYDKWRTALGADAFTPFTD